MDAQIRKARSWRAALGMAEFTSHGAELRQKAFEGVRHVKRRQSDAEEMIGRGIGWPMMDLANSIWRLPHRFAKKRAFCCATMRKHRTSSSRPAVQLGKGSNRPLSSGARMAAQPWLRLHGRRGHYRKRGARISTG